MVHLNILLTSILAIAGVVMTSPIKKQEPVVTYLGNQGSLLSGGALTTTKGLLYTSGTTPSFNGSIVEGGIGPQTAQVLTNIGGILEEGGTSWENVLKCTLLLENISDFSTVNEIYESTLPNPKPARTTYEVGKLPGDFLIEIECIAAIPDS